MPTNETHPKLFLIDVYQPNAIKELSVDSLIPTLAYTYKDYLFVAADSDLQKKYVPLLPLQH